jgi:hypothetical protein
MAAKGIPMDTSHLLSKIRIIILMKICGYLDVVPGSASTSYRGDYALIYAGGQREAEIETGEFENWIKLLA